MGKTFTTEVVFSQLIALNHSAHRAIDDDDPSAEKILEFRRAILTVLNLFFHNFPSQ